MNEQNTFYSAETQSTVSYEELPLPSTQNDSDRYLAILEDLRRSLEADDAAQTQQFEPENTREDDFSPAPENFLGQPEQNFEQNLDFSSAPTETETAALISEMPETGFAATDDNEFIPEPVSEEYITENSEELSETTRLEETGRAEFEMPAGESFVEDSFPARREESFTPENPANQFMPEAEEASISEPSDTAQIDAPEAEATAKIKYFVFKIDEQLYAFPQANAAEISGRLHITPLPLVPSWMLGATNLQNEIVAVVDLRRLWNKQPVRESENQKMLLVESGEADLRVCFAVDETLESCEFTDDELVATFDVPFAPYMRGVFKPERGALCLIDTEQFLGSSNSR